MTTQKQKAAVDFCFKWLKVPFNGDINNFKEVSEYLSIYLDEAKNIAEEATADYLSFMADKDYY